jgi:hypothetical protein
MIALAEGLPQAIEKSGRPGYDAVDHLVGLFLGIRDGTGGLRAQIAGGLYAIGDRPASNEVCFHFHDHLSYRSSE